MSLMTQPRHERFRCWSRSDCVSPIVTAGTEPETVAGSSEALTAATDALAVSEALVTSLQEQLRLAQSDMEQAVQEREGRMANVASLQVCVA